MIKHPKTGTCKRSSHNTLEPPCSLWSQQSDCPVLCCDGFRMYYRWVASVRAWTLGIASSQICSRTPNCFSSHFQTPSPVSRSVFSCWTAHSWSFDRKWFSLPRCRQNNTSVSKQTQASAAGEHSAYSHSALVCSSLLIPSVSPSHPLSLSLSFHCCLSPFPPISLSRWLWFWGGSVGLANRLAANQWRPTAGIFWARNFLRAQTAPENGAFKEISSQKNFLHTHTKKKIHNKNILAMGRYLKISDQSGVITLEAKLFKKTNINTFRAPRVRRKTISYLKKQKSRKWFLLL